MKKAWLSFFSGEAWVANPLMLSPAMGCLLIFFIFPMIATVVAHPYAHKIEVKQDEAGLSILEA